jgi:L-asparaginase
MNKDSSEMTKENHIEIANCVHDQSFLNDGVIVIHGTDTLAETGNQIIELYPRLEKPCILTGAMRPWIMRNTDALQNLVESFTAVQLVPSGVYVAMHNRVLQFPGVTKDTKQMRFVKN